MKQEVGYYLHREGPNLGKHYVPCLLLPSTLDAQFGTPYPRSAGFDTDNYFMHSNLGLCSNNEERGESCSINLGLDSKSK